jgi:hypothetical protein
MASPHGSAASLAGTDAAAAPPAAAGPGAVPPAVKETLLQRRAASSDSLNQLVPGGQISLATAAAAGPGSTAAPAGLAASSWVSKESLARASRPELCRWESLNPAFVDVAVTNATIVKNEKGKDRMVFRIVVRGRIRKSLDKKQESIESLSSHPRSASFNNLDAILSSSPAPGSDGMAAASSAAQPTSNPTGNTNPTATATASASAVGSPASGGSAATSAPGSTRTTLGSASGASASAALAVAAARNAASRFDDDFRLWVVEKCYSDFLDLEYKVRGLVCCGGCKVLSCLLTCFYPSFSALHW